MTEQKVYLVALWPHGDLTKIFGIFTSKDTAESVRADYIRVKKPSVAFTPTITEFTLDKRIE